MDKLDDWYFMMKKYIYSIYFILIISGFSVYSAQQTKSIRLFKASGNSDPTHHAEKLKRGEVVVTFEMLPTRMSFNLPSFPCLVTENNISYYNGWTETYDEAAGEGSCEPLMDRNNVYSRMWIESQNNARIVVRWRAALLSSDGIIAHKDAPSVSPYGPGDWVDESYIIYPDGVHVRKSKIYTYYAPSSKPFGWDRDPPNYVFEFQEMLFLGDKGRLPEDDIHTKALTLIKMDGSHKTISYDPYPIHFEPEEDELYAAFGDFWNANIFVVRTKSEYQPFTIGREEGVSISPYAPERETRKGIFQSWPQNPNREEGYDGTALGHIIHRTLYNKTETTISQIYLSGFIHKDKQPAHLATLANSWLHAPPLKFDNNISGWEYDPAQRAYLVDLKNNSDRGSLEFEINSTENTPLYNPAFIFSNWGSSEVSIEKNGIILKSGTDLRLGNYQNLELDDGRVWKDVLLIWMAMKSSETVKIKIQRK